MKMKISKMLLTAGICIIGFSSVFAQDRRAGIKGGLNVSNLYVDNTSDENARLGFQAGVYGEVVSLDAFALQLELNYSTKGSKYVKDGFINQTTQFNLNYLDLPVLAVFKLGKSVDLHAGTYFAYLLSSNVTTEGTFGSGSNTLDNDNFNALDYGLSAGIGFNFGPAQIGARYNYGLNKIAKSDAANNAIGNSKNSFGQVYIAFNLLPVSE